MFAKLVSQEHSITMLEMRDGDLKLVIPLMNIVVRMIVVSIIKVAFAKIPKPSTRKVRPQCVGLRV